MPVQPGYDATRVQHAKAVGLGVVASGITAILALVFNTHPMIAAGVSVGVGVAIFAVAELRDRVVVRRSGVLSDRPPADTLPPPSGDTLKQAILKEEWGASRYRPESAWNAEEARAYLWLHRRDAGSQGFRVTVFDPTNVSSDTKSSAMAGDRLVALYPDHFHDAPTTMSGTYQVVWKVLVDEEGGPALREVARDSFIVL